MKHNFWISLLAASSLGLWSCTSDSLTNGPDDNIEPEGGIPESGYLGFRLTEADASGRSTHKEYDDDYERFEWFNKGTKEERAIIDNSDCNSVLFFYADYSYYGNGKLQKPNVAGAPENVYVARKPASMEGLPAYAIVILNSDPDRLSELDTSLKGAGKDAVKTVMNYLNEVDTDDPESLAKYDGYFTMTSVIYKEEDGTAVAGLTPLKTETPIFYKTIEEAIQPENLTSFYAERILAKFTLIIKDGNKRFGNDEAIIIKGANQLKIRTAYHVEDGSTNKDVMTGWSINLVNWGLNGLEKNTYLLKTLQENPASYPWDITENFYVGWNSPRLMRSYWSIDENYYTGIYPDQYRESLDVDGVKSATTNNIYSDNYDPKEGLAKGNYTLVYKPYSAFTDRTDDKYSVENTFDACVLSDQDLLTKPYLRCGTHIILTAQFLIDEIDKNIDPKNIDETGFLKGVADKYFSNGLYWSEDALLKQATATLLASIYYNNKNFPITNVLGEGNVDFINTDEKPLAMINPIVDAANNPVTMEKASDFFEFGPAFIQGGDGWVSLKVKDGVKLKANYEDGTTGDISTSQLVSYIYRFTNLAKHYKEGRMYYALAIRHNLESVNFEENPATKVSTGDYGVVRNTWYRLTLTSILSPGTPVDDPDQPIIPNNEPDDKSLGVEVKVIPWATVDINVDQLH